MKTLRSDVYVGACSVETALSHGSPLDSLSFNNRAHRQDRKSTVVHTLDLFQGDRARSPLCNKLYIPGFPYPQSSSTSIDVFFFRSKRCKGQSTVVPTNVLAKLSRFRRLVHQQSVQLLRRVLQAFQPNFTVVTTKGELRRGQSRPLQTFVHPVKRTTVCTDYVHGSECQCNGRLNVRSSCDGHDRCCLIVRGRSRCL